MLDCWSYPVQPPCVQWDSFSPPPEARPEDAVYLPLLSFHPLDVCVSTVEARREALFFPLVSLPS